MGCKYRTIPLKSMLFYLNGMEGSIPGFFASSIRLKGIVDRIKDY
jgi:hypothetical protein